MRARPLALEASPKALSLEPAIFLGEVDTAGDLADNDYPLTASINDQRWGCVPEPEDEIRSAKEGIEETLERLSVPAEFRETLWQYVEIVEQASLKKSSLLLDVHPLSPEEGRPLNTNREFRTLAGLERQRRVADFITTRFKSDGGGQFVGLNEIASEFNMSPGGVRHYLEALMNLGLITRNPNKRAGGYAPSDRLLKRIQ